MKSLVLSLALILTLSAPLAAGPVVKELVKGAVPASHVSVFCINGFQFTAAAFCGSAGCGITMVQIFEAQGKPATCK